MDQPYIEFLDGQPCKDMLGKQIQPDILSQPEKRVKMNETIANTGNL